MIHPYFSVGEEVILAPKRLHKYAGEYVVEEVISPGSIVKCRITDYPKILGDNEYAYRLVGLCVDCEDYSHAFEAVWAQSSLRKKHKPADDEFTEELKNILSNVLTDSSETTMMSTSKQQKEKQQ